MKFNQMSRNAKAFVRQMAALPAAQRAVVRAKFQRVLDDPAYQEQVVAASAEKGYSREEALRQTHAIIAAIDAVS